MKLRLEDGTTRTEKQYPGGTSTTTTDAKGRLLEGVIDFENLYHRETHQYDEFGREIEKVEWNRDGSMINLRTYDYSDNPQDNSISRTELFCSLALSEPVEGKSQSDASLMERSRITPLHNFCTNNLSVDNVAS
jgi:hypothetical protein